VRVRNWHAIWQGVLAFAVLVTAGTTLSDLTGPRVAGLMGLAVAGLQAATAAYFAALGQRPPPPPPAA
jgi:CHASE2 domain-containing sensor protein